MKTQLIYRSGLTTIGGTIIELIKNDTRLIFDIGVLFDPVNHQETLPNVQGIFEGESKYNDFILLSHLHLDHSKAMNLVKNEIPVYMSKASKEFYDDLIIAGFDQIEGPHNNKIGIDFKQSVQLGAFKVTFLSVDHDVVGASAILIENEDLTLFYSGDLCIHGRNNADSFDTIDYLANKNIDVSIFEGVTISFIEDDYKLVPSKNVDKYEADFAKELSPEIENNKIILFNSYIMGIERLKSIHELAISLNRKIVILASSEHLYKKYIGVEYLVLDRDIKIEEIDENYMLQFDFFNKEAYEKLNKSAFLIQTGGSPLGAYDPNWQVLIDFCAANDITFFPCGLGGHGAPEHIAYIANEIAAKYLMPLHSFKPQLLKVENSQQLMPEIDRVYEFDNHDLI